MFGAFENCVVLVANLLRTEDKSIWSELCLQI